MTDCKKLKRQIISQMKSAGEFLKWGSCHDNLPFKSAGMASTKLIEMLSGSKGVLCMRDQSLGPVRLTVLHRHIKLIIASKIGYAMYDVPASARIPDGDGFRLLLEKINRHLIPYTGPVDYIVVSCLAFDPLHRDIYSFDNYRTADILEGLRDKFTDSFSHTVTICLAADEQQVSNWPDNAFGGYAADAVITPTRFIILGSGETCFPEQPTREALASNNL